MEGVFTWTVSPEVTSPTKCDVVVSYLTDGLTRWDGQVHISILQLERAAENLNTNDALG